MMSKDTNEPEGVPESDDDGQPDDKQSVEIPLDEPEDD